MKKNLIQVAIDGPAGSGKTTVSKIVAAHYNIYYLSSGKIFRSYAYALKSIDPKDQEAVVQELKSIKFKLDNERFTINGIDVTSAILSDMYSLPASIISAYPFTRKKYLKDIKRIVKSQSVVIDGRDIGTVVMPKTKYKFYLDASAPVRAERRTKELNPDAKVGSDLYKKILEEIKVRDKQDTTREIAPLVRASDAFYVDSDKLTAIEVADVIIKHIDEIRG